jgi:hypothetical protein
VDAPPVAAAVPQLRDAADGAVMQGTRPAMALSNNAKTALVLASIVAVFFFGIMLKYWWLR